MNFPRGMGPMKRFFFLSFLFHGVVLLLLSSWGIPGADRSFPGNIIKVSLVEIKEKKAEEEKPPSSRPEQANGPAKKKTAPPKKVEALRRVAPAKREGKKAGPEIEMKKEEPKPKPPQSEPPGKEEPKLKQAKQEVQPIPAESKAEEPKAEEKVPPVDPIGQEKTGKPSAGPVNPAGPLLSGGKLGESAPGGNPGVSGRREDSGITFLASTGAPGEKGGIPLGRAGESPRPGGGGPTRTGSIQTSSPGGDQVLSEIMRRIEGAKRYPRVARRMGIEGKTTIRFRLRPDGKVDSVQVVESSGSDILDAASLETVRRAVPLPFKEGWLKVVIVFKIL
jgi:protein TonB